MQRALIMSLSLLAVLVLLIGIGAGTCGGNGDENGAIPPGDEEEALVTPTPAEFEVISLDVEPSEIIASETVTITAVVENTGGSEGTYTAILTVDGAAVETKDVVITPNSSETVTFTLVKDKLGTYEIGVGGLNASLTVIDTWTLSTPLYLLGVIGGGTFMELLSYQESWGLSFGFEGSSSFDNLCQQISEYWDSIQQSNTIIVFSTSLENLQRLGEWPGQYKEVCPFSVEELVALDPPFALLERQDNGLIRAIILVDNEPDIVTFVTVIKDKQVPVGIPWTLTDGEVTVIE
jgi:hypothetical protein